MTVLYLYPYKIGSKSCRNLTDELRGRGIRTLRLKQDSNPKARNRLVITWGMSQLPDWQGYLDGSLKLNTPGAVSVASDKRACLDMMQRAEVPAVEHTTQVGQINDWLEEGATVVGRTVLNGHSGNGIVLISDQDELDYALGKYGNRLRLFTKYFKKKAEYRVHVFNGQVIDVQQKRKRNDMDREDVNFQVRNHHNGWVFCREDVTDDERLRNVAVQAVRAIPGLDFGAVDIGYNEHHDEYRVFEINTACGLEGTSLRIYADAIQQYIDNM